MTTGLAPVTSNSPLARAKSFKSNMAGDPKFFGYDASEVVRAYRGNLPVGATTLYTCPTWKRAVSIGGLYVIHNPTAGAIAFDFHQVPSGGSVQTSNRIGNFSINADQTLTIITSTLWHVVMSGDSLIINPGTQGLNAWGMFNEERADAAAFIGGFVGNIGAATETTALTCPATRTLVLASIVGHNYNAGLANISAHIRESGVAASDTNEVMSTVGLAAAGEFSLDRYGHAACGEGGVVSVLSSVTNVNFWVNAVLI